MGPALNTASSMGAYILADRGTWLAFKNRGDLAILVEGDKRLFNQYGVMLVNPEKHAHVKTDLGEAFIDWVVSPEGQKAIADYKIGGEQLFFPNCKPAGDACTPSADDGADGGGDHAGRSGGGPVRLYAAGSLRAVMTDMATAYAAATGAPVEGEFGASGLMRERIEKGEPAEVFASADMEPSGVARRRRGARGRSCSSRGIACARSPRRGLEVTTDTLLERMLDPAIKLGTSTPKSDPSGDYTWELFEKAEKPPSPALIRRSRRQGAEARRRSGQPAAAARPQRLRQYLIASGDADIFLTYCTNALRRAK